MFEKIRTFLSEVYSELKRVSWPTRKETVNSTMVVITLMVILGFFLFIVDSLLARFVGVVIG